MALIRADIFSRSLMRTVPITAVIPVDNVRFAHEKQRPIDLPYKTLYLLHGLYGSNMDWLVGSDVFLLSQAYNLAVIMPAGENAFYVDNAASGEKYGSFIGEELVDLTRRLFPLSHRREDTYIAGLSMGGYGALRSGLKYGDTFSKAAGLSSGFIFKMMLDSDNSSEDYTQTRHYYESMFGNLDKIPGSENDCVSLIKQARTAGRLLPDIYMAIGTEDFLLAANRDMKKQFEDLKVNLTYVEEFGDHDFNFWNRQLKSVFEWLPLETPKSPY